MITGRTDKTLNLRGLSTDTKPTEYIGNGSIFLEMDNSKYYIFDEENKQWYPINKNLANILSDR